jgi:hypothetical protein
MKTKRLPRRVAGLWTLLLALCAAAASPAAAQSRLADHRVETAALAGDLHPDVLESPVLARGDYAVVVDLDTYRLHFMRGFEVLWSAKVGVGTGLRLKGPSGEWKFDTPRGVYQVQYKEINPVWNKPDWFYVENNQPIPPPDHPSRRLPGGLGSAAVYIGDELAIHGTDRPELLGQNVSRGCIRLSNRDALRLFHNVQIGTQVIIVGDSVPRVRRPPASQVRGSASRSSVEIENLVPEPWPRMSTQALLDQLDEELWVAGATPEESLWTDAASLLLKRALDDDDRAALRGLLVLAHDIEDRRLASEYATFLADAYSRGTLQTLTAIAMLPPAQRARVAELLVRTSLGLYPGELDDTAAPWPTRRVLRSSLSAVTRRAWDLLHTAEREYRESRAVVEV